MYECICILCQEVARALLSLALITCAFYYGDFLIVNVKGAQAGTRQGHGWDTVGTREAERCPTNNIIYYLGWYIYGVCVCVCLTFVFIIFNICTVILLLRARAIQTATKINSTVDGIASHKLCYRYIKNNALYTRRVQGVERGWRGGGGGVLGGGCSWAC